MDRPDPHDPDPRDLHARDPFRDPFSADPFPVTDANDPFRPKEPGSAPPEAAPLPALPAPAATTPATLAPRPDPGTGLLPAPPAQPAERGPAEATGRRSALGVVGPLLLVAGLICVVTGFLGFAAERTGPAEGDDATAPMVLFGVGTLALVTGTALSNSGRDGPAPPAAASTRPRPRSGPAAQPAVPRPTPRVSGSAAGAGTTWSDRLE